MKTANQDSSEEGADETCIGIPGRQSPMTSWRWRVREKEESWMPRLTLSDRVNSTDQGVQHILRCVGGRAHQWQDGCVGLKGDICTCRMGSVCRTAGGDVHLEGAMRRLKPRSVVWGGGTVMGVTEVPGFTMGLKKTSLSWGVIGEEG